MRPRSDREAWLVLACACGIGPRTAGSLVRAFGGPARAAGASASALSRHPDFSGEKGARLARAIADVDPVAVLARAEAAGLSVSTPADDDYPARLRASPDGPAALFVRGRIPATRVPGRAAGGAGSTGSGGGGGAVGAGGEVGGDAPERPWVAVVGTRAASPYGIRVARTLAEDLARGGVVVVSGLARGVDGVAHSAALRGGGLTVAAVGCGADVVYPPEHASLAAEIAERGAIVSEHPPGTPPLAGHFPRRNRIVAALAHVVVVVEAPETSGALLTARIAIELGREVLVVPGPVDRGTHAGCHRLLREGSATVCEGARDVWRALGDASGGPPGAAASAAGAPGEGGAASRSGLSAEAGAPPGGPARVLWQALDRDEALDADELARRTGLSPDVVAAGITDLELDGRVVRVPGVGVRRT